MTLMHMYILRPVPIGYIQIFVQWLLVVSNGHYPPTNFNVSLKFYVSLPQYFMIHGVFPKITTFVAINGAYYM